MQRGQAPRRQAAQRPQQRRVSQPQQRSRRRKKNYTLHYLLLFAFCIVLGVTLCTNVLFKVSTIQVKNNSYYSSEEIITRSGIKKEDKLFGINTGYIESMLEDRFPYIQSVEIKRQLPATVVIELVEETPMGAAYTDEGYVIVSSTGKVLKTKVSAPPEGIPVLLGLEDMTYTVGSYLYELAEENGKNTRIIAPKVQLIQEFSQKAAEYGLAELTYISISDSEEIEALYDGRILIDFGGEIDLEKKLNFVKTVLDQGIANNHPLSGYTNENFEGSIDITDRKQLRTRALAVRTIADERAFTVFETEDAFFSEDEEVTEEVTEELPEEIAEEATEEQPQEEQE